MTARRALLRLGAGLLAASAAAVTGQSATAQSPSRGPAADLLHALRAGRVYRSPGPDNGVRFVTLPGRDNGDSLAWGLTILGSDAVLTTLLIPTDDLAIDERVLRGAVS